MKGHRLAALETETQPAGGLLVCRHSLGYRSVPGAFQFTSRGETNAWRARRFAEPSTRNVAKSPLPKTACETLDRPHASVEIPLETRGRRHRCAALALAASRPAPRMIPDQERRSSQKRERRRLIPLAGNPAGNPAVPLVACHRSAPWVQPNPRHRRRAGPRFFRLPSNSLSFHRRFPTSQTPSSCNWSPALKASSIVRPQVR